MHPRSVPILKNTSSEFREIGMCKLSHESSVILSVFAFFAEPMQISSFEFMYL